MDPEVDNTSQQEVATAAPQQVASNTAPVVPAYGYELNKLMSQYGVTSPSAPRTGDQQLLDQYFNQMNSTPMYATPTGSRLYNNYLTNAAKDTNSGIRIPGPNQPPAPPPGGTTPFPGGTTPPPGGTTPPPGGTTPPPNSGSSFVLTPDHITQIQQWAASRGMDPQKAIDWTRHQIANGVIKSQADFDAFVARQNAANPVVFAPPSAPKLFADPGSVNPENFTSQQAQFAKSIKPYLSSDSTGDAMTDLQKYIKYAKSGESQGGANVDMVEVGSLLNLADYYDIPLTQVVDLLNVPNVTVESAKKLLRDYFPNYSYNYLNDQSKMTPYSVPAAPVVTPAPVIQSAPAAKSAAPAVSSQDIQKWFQYNPGASDAQIAAAMSQNKVTPEQLAAAMNVDPAVVAARYAAQGYAKGGQVVQKFGGGGVAEIDPIQAMMQKYAIASENPYESPAYMSANDAYKQAVSNAMNQSVAQAPSDAEKYFQLAAAFATPGKTGSFMDQVANAGSVMSENMAAQRAATEANRKQQLANAVSLRKLDLDELTDRLDWEHKRAQEVAAAAREERLANQPASEWGRAARDLGIYGTPEGEQFIRGSVEADKENDAARAAAATARAANIGQPTLSEDAVNDAAARFLLTGQLPPGMSRNSANLSAVYNAASNLAKESGNDSQATVIATMANQADQRSYANLQKQLDAISAFEGTAIKNLNMLVDQANKVDLGAFPLVNQALLTGKMNVGDPEAAKLMAIVKPFVDEYAKILSGSTGAAGATDTARREAAEIIAPYMSPETINALAPFITQELNNRTGSMEEQLVEITERMKSRQYAKGSEPAEISTAGGNATPQSPTTDQLRAYLQAGRPSDPAKAAAYDKIASQHPELLSN